MTDALNERLHRGFGQLGLAIDRLNRDAAEAERVDLLLQGMEAIDEAYHAGVTACSEGDLDVAERELRRAARGGHPEAALELAKLLVGLPSSDHAPALREAALWLREAVNGGATAREDLDHDLAILLDTKVTHPKAALESHSAAPLAPLPLTPATTFEDARANLRRFVQFQAAASAQIVGFGWRGDPGAPVDYRSLLHAYARSQLTGAPLPVSDEPMERTICVDGGGNLAFRFWHDITHARLGMGFDLDGEIEVARAHLDVLAAAGFPPGSLEFELLRTDTLGQTLCGAATDHFPTDQICFARLSRAPTLAAAIRHQLDEPSPAPEAAAATPTRFTELERVDAYGDLLEANLAGLVDAYRGGSVRVQAAFASEIADVVLGMETMLRVVVGGRHRAHGPDVPGAGTVDATEVGD